MSQLIRIKDRGVLSAESIVTVRVSVEYRLDDEPEPVYFSVQITAPASDLDLFLIPYSDDENANLEIDILDVYQPRISKHDENLKWLDYLIDRDETD